MSVGQIHRGRVVLTLALLVVCLPACNEAPPAMAPPATMEEETALEAAKDLMHDLSNELASFRKLASSFKNAADVEAAAVELNKSISELELLVDRSQLVAEPHHSEMLDLNMQRFSLQMTIGQYNDQIDLIADNAAIWKAFRPYFERFDAVLKMVQLIPVDSAEHESLEAPSSAHQE